MGDVLALVAGDASAGGGGGGEAEDDAWRRHRSRTARRKSRVTRQHSYDDELKNSSGGGGGGADGQLGGPGGGDNGLGLPMALPRRASAYDVYAVRSGAEPGLAAARLQGPQQAATAGAGAGGGGGRCPNGLGDAVDDAAVPPAQAQRRPSFRAAGFDLPSSPMSPEAGSPTAMALGVDDDRRSRRRGSQMVERALPQTPLSGATAAGAARPSSTPPRNMDDLRQGSVAGEDIKIVIHDVDSDANFNSRPGAKRRVVLRRDPSDKAHRTRGFGMRVVGGKTGNDGRLFAYIVWTVPGGPAEKGGLQQGDKVLEWDGVPLTDRSFEEVCDVMDRAGEMVELVVEHATDLRMCDLLDEPTSLMTMSRKANENLVMQLEPDEKAPTSPTRRKLPKTPV